MPNSFNLSEASLFLSYFEKRSPQITFQTFHHKKKGLASVHHGTLAQCRKDLVAFQKRGSGIFLMVNVGDGRGRRKENVIAVRALFVDLDGAPLQPILEAKLKPHLITESSRGRFHAYWFVRDCELASFSSLQSALATKFDGDRSITDLCRVMRVPGFYHFKDGLFLSRIVASNDCPTYSTKEIIERLDLRFSEKVSDLGENFDAERVRSGQVSEGERNSQLYKLAWYFCGQGFSKEEIESEIISANSKIQVPLDQTEATQIIENAIKHFWLDVVPLQQEGPKECPYPIDSLPELLRAAVIEHQSYAQQPISLVASAGLAALSLACQGVANVARDEHMIGPISLYFMVIAESGERKTTADQAFSGPIRIWEREKTKELEIYVQEQEAAQAAWMAKKAGYESKLKASAGTDNKPNKLPSETPPAGTKAEGASTYSEATTSDLEAQFKTLCTQRPKKTLLPFLFYESVTQEKFIEDLAYGWPSASLWSGEGGIVVGGYSMNPENALKLFSVLNKLWSNESISRRTKGSGDCRVEGRRMTTNLMFQKAVFKKLIALDDGVSRAVGLLARTLIVMPESTMGKRLYKEPPTKLECMDRYGEKLKSILELGMPDADGNLNLRTLRLNSEAKNLWVNYFNQVETDLTGAWTDSKDIAAKSAENAARIAANFHILEHSVEEEISAATMSNAIELARWHLVETNRVLGNTSKSEETENAQLLLQWLKEQTVRKLSIREIRRMGPNKLRASSVLARAVELLCQGNYVRRINAGTWLVLREGGW